MRNTYNKEDYTVDTKKLYKNRKDKGVSGMMRVRNDAEFLQLSVESCIDALDELIIVYNNCNDDSPAIIDMLYHKYPDKIKVYHYLPEILAWDLTEEIANDIIDGKIDSQNTLAGYYNYALSKTSYKYVLKIDADQIYNLEQLKYVCDLYRHSYRKYNSADIIFLIIIKALMSISVRSGKYIDVLYKKRIVEHYHSSLANLISAKKKPISLSGINVVSYQSNLFVSLGKYIPDGINIMAPFNGEGDHLVFEVKKGVMFKPAVDYEYNRLNGNKLNVIETLSGTGSAWIWGIPMWIHLNACRKNIFNKILKNLTSYPNYYCKLKDFFKGDYKTIVQISDNEIFNAKRKQLFHFVFSSTTNSNLDYYLKVNKRITDIINYDK